MKEFITQKDLDLIQEYAGHDYEESKHHELKDIYEKLDHFCRLLVPHGFEYDIRKDPRKQAGQGLFQFRDYQWARVYPSEYYDSCNDKFSYIIGLSDSLHFHMMGYKDFQNLPPSKEASQKSWCEVDIANSDYSIIVQKFLDFDKSNRYRYIQTAAALGIQGFNEILKNMKNQELTNLLEFKKQIILQGPPGTGKTRLAKIIANKLTKRDNISEADIMKILTPGIWINSSTDYTKYLIKEIGSVNVTVEISNKSQYKPSFNEIINAYKIQMWNGKQVGGNDPYSAAIAKFIYESEELNNRVKLIQFHPAYTYEDFVRGIVAKNRGNSISYDTENKILAQFADRAFKNWLTINKPEQVSHQIQAREWITDFKEYIVSKLEEEEKLMLTRKVYFSRITEKTIRYNSDAWEVDGGVPDADLEKMYLAGITTRKQVKEMESLTKTAKSLATYWLKTLELFKKFVSENTLNQVDSIAATQLENYVLVVDEINRANLPAVLGELIYALEYRGEEVESMYEIEGEGNKLVLPPNLYIIGTMNTADRSVGHIDYAIRRRFAFVDVLPKEIPELTENGKKLFQNVAKLFCEEFREEDLTLKNSKYLASDFKPTDVILGHSYFLVKGEDRERLKISDDEILGIKLKYEIEPLLREYIKDGILTKETETEIAKLKVGA